MGQKVRPTGFRVGIMTDWGSTWYANKADFSELLLEDLKIRKYIKAKFKRSGVSKIRIERTRERVTVHIHSAKVGVMPVEFGHCFGQLVAVHGQLVGEGRGSWLGSGFAGGWRAG